MAVWLTAKSTEIEGHKSQNVTEKMGSAIAEEKK